tara:strand:+ start:255 stop:584 length:330 start_codon:yes stop_codon:yes gene_type:complete
MEHMKSSGGTDVKERPPKRIKAKIKPPRQFKVIYHNDDYTPMEFVSWSLIAFFNKTEEEANSLTLEVHKVGKAVAGIYDLQIAETKISEVLESARENQYPLSVTGEPIE